MNDERSAAALYQHFLKAFNDRDIDDVAEIIDQDFKDHHPGFNVNGAKSYLEALRKAYATLDLTASVDDIFESEDKVVTRVMLTGKHIGEVFGIQPTGRSISWTSTEIWRMSDGRFVERWAEDDLLGLRNQLTDDSANVALITKLNDVVNERRYDDMDELFAPDFVDNNPAWSVQNLSELKDIIRTAHEALDFTSHHDLIYAADGGKVVIHITFSGRHVKPFFDREPTGKAVRWTSIEVYRIVNRRIAERWVQADTTGLMAQLGVPLP